MNTKKTIHVSGKRKSAIARATIHPGNGKVTINNKSLEIIEPEMYRYKISEPIILAGNRLSKVDISVTVIGGGISGQADAIRLSIAKAISKYFNDSELNTIFLNYDRQLLVADIRRKETRKPNSHGKARAKRQKSYR